VCSFLQGGVYFFRGMSISSGSVEFFGDVCISSRVWLFLTGVLFLEVGLFLLRWVDFCRA